MQITAVIYVSPTILLIVHRNMWFNIIFWCCARSNCLQRYSNSSALNRKFKAAHIEGIVTLEWQTHDCILITNFCAQITIYS